jgi:hypothetical protein
MMVLRPVWIHPRRRSTVTAGTLTLDRRDCAARSYTAGQTFVERGRHDVVLARNQGWVPAETITTLIVRHRSVAAGLGPGL